jgi:hypothetical protein
MGGWVRYLQLQAKAKTGLSAAFLVWSVVAVLALAGTLAFLTTAGFIWLAERYDALTAALIMAGAFFVIAIVAGLCCLVLHRNAVTRARLALAERKHQPWLDPAMLGLGFQIGRSVGWGRLLSLGAVAVLAAGLGREWFGGRDKPGASESSEDASED